MYLIPCRLSYSQLHMCNWGGRSHWWYHPEVGWWQTVNYLGSSPSRPHWCIPCMRLSLKIRVVHSGLLISLTQLIINVKHIVVEGARLLAKPLCKSSFIPSHTYALGLQARPDPFHSVCETVPDLGKHWYQPTWWLEKQIGIEGGDNLLRWLRL